MKRTLLRGVILSAVWGFACAPIFAQASETRWLTPTNFRAPEFPVAEPSNLLEGPGEQNRPNLGRPEGTPNEPSLPQAGPQGPVWINSNPLTMAGLRGKVVLIDFWEYTCINCIRTFAENKRWYQRYHADGFEIIGVHDPEFDIAYSPDNVRVAVKRFGLPYPIVVDTGFRIWNSYHNSTWPSRFLVDAKGVVRFHRDGEGGDSAFEEAIQKLLVEARPDLKFPASDTFPPDKNAFAASCGNPTPEMYVGNWFDRGILANAEGYHNEKTLNYKIPDQVADGHAAVSGPWQTDKNGMNYRGKHKGESDDKLVMRYHARELYTVMNVSHGSASKVYILQDGKDLTDKDKGVDVRFDKEGHSYIEVREPRMYYLVANPAFGSHEVTLLPTKSGLTVNSFTFGNDCQTDFPHL